MAKSARKESAFPLWRRGIPRLARALSKAKALGKLIPEDDVQGQAGLIELDLRINREVRETLLAEMRVRREVVELRKLELDGMTEDEVEQLLIRTAQRRGFRSLDGIRRGAVEYLTSRGASPDAARMLVDEVIPPADNVEAKRKRLKRALGQSYDALAEDLEAGAADVREALEGDPGSESQEPAQPVAPATASDTSDTDEARAPFDPEEP